MTFELIDKQRTKTTVANTDVMVDHIMTKDGLLHISVGTTDAADLRITLDGTNYQTIIDTGADIMTTLIIAVEKGAVFNYQTVAIEILDITIILES